MSRPLLEVQGGRELRRTLKAAGNDLSDLKEAHRDVADIVAPAARAEAPIGSTGRLAGSVRGSGAAASSTIRAGRASVPYAGPIHWGWPGRNIEPNPFIVRGAEQTEPRWTDTFRRAIERIVNRIKGA